MDEFHKNQDTVFSFIEIMLPDGQPHLMDVHACSLARIFARSALQTLSIPIFLS